MYSCVRQCVYLYDLVKVWMCGRVGLAYGINVSPSQFGIPNITLIIGIETGRLQNVRVKYIEELTI